MKAEESDKSGVSGRDLESSLVSGEGGLVGARQVRKRDGRAVAYEEGKVADAIFKAVLAVGGRERAKSEDEARQVTAILEERFFSRGAIPDVEQIQDVVESVLVHNGHAKTAKAYILYRAQRTEFRQQKVALFRRNFKTNLSMNALKVIAARYVVRDEQGSIVETPNEMFGRVARALAEVEKDYGIGEDSVAALSEKFKTIMMNAEFIPAGRTLANAGGPTPLVSNCIVLHMDDSMDGIFSTLREAALLQQAGSGLGFPFHLLRPAGTMTVKSRGVASGPVSFLDVYNQAFGVIKQQGRHGANMAIMRVDHPDILDFIHCKAVEGEIRNFNISIALTDKFMAAIDSASDEPWVCSFNGKNYLPRRITRDKWNSITTVKEERMTARDIMNELVTAAWNNGEPGVVFIDSVNRTNPLPGCGRIEACNPCGEQFLHDGDVCNLGSINLEKFVRSEDSTIDYPHLKEVVHLSVRLLDNVIDRTHFPVDRVNRTCKANRRVGLGLMGFADMLYKMSIRYNSEEGFSVAEEVSAFINAEAHRASEIIAKEKGIFPNWDKSVYKAQGVRMRNAALTTIAPTGSISMIYDVASGLEPYFALVYEKSNIMGGQVLHYVNRHLEARLKERGIFSEDLMKKIARTGSVQGIEEIPTDIQKVFVTALDIPAEDHIRMQAAFQKNVDNSISKTINFPYGATKEDVMAGYVHAWKMGCKGCTVYRNDSRKVQILNLVKEEKERKGSADNEPAAASPAAVAAAATAATAAVAEDRHARHANVHGAQHTPHQAVRPEALPPLEAMVASQTPQTIVIAPSFVASKSALSSLDACLICKSANIQYAEGCLTCKECGYSACSL